MNVNKPGKQSARWCVRSFSSLHSLRLSHSLYTFLFLIFVSLRSLHIFKREKCVSEWNPNEESGLNEAHERTLCSFTCVCLVYSALHIRSERTERVIRDYLCLGHASY